MHVVTNIINGKKKVFGSGKAASDQDWDSLHTQRVPETMHGERKHRNRDKHVSPNHIISISSNTQNILKYVLMTFHSKEDLIGNSLAFII